VLGAEYAALGARLEAGADGLIPAYGATDPAEFFAVVSELYFEQPAALKREHAALYEQLRKAYRTDPCTWQ
jgi:Mlc titration factor MtfA (ptsG expression regulator)